MSWIFGLQNSKNPIHQMIYEYMEKRREHVLVKTYQEAVQRVMDSNYAFIGESISQDLAAARHCNLIRAPEVIGARGFGIATSQGEPPSPVLPTPSWEEQQEQGQQRPEPTLLSG